MALSTNVLLQVDKIVKLYSEHQSMSYIAQEVGTSQHTIREVLKLKNIDLRGKTGIDKPLCVKMYKNNRSIKEIASHFAVTKKRIITILVQNKVKFRPEDVRYSYDAVDSRIQQMYDVVRDVITKMEISVNGEKGKRIPEGNMLIAELKKIQTEVYSIKGKVKIYGDKNPVTQLQTAYKKSKELEKD